jgi:group I intron endonuclease
MYIFYWNEARIVNAFQFSSLLDQIEGVRNKMATNITGDVSKEGFVYLWTNQINGRWYVGSHEGHPADGYIGSGKIFKLAVRKYGLKSFVREILYQGIYFREEEEKILVELDAANDPSSYNMKDRALGGTSGTKRSEETKRRISESNKGRVHTKKSRMNMSLAHMEIEQSKETKEKRGRTLKIIGHKPPPGSHSGHRHSEKAKTRIRNARITQDEEFCSKGGLTSSHIRWHVNRGIVNPSCVLCRKIEKESL